MKLLVLSFVIASSLYAQSAQLSGFVKDASDSAVPSAKLTLTNQDTAVERQTQPNDSGQYSFPALAPGRYMLVVEASGFETLKREGIIVEVSQNARIDFTLKVGATGQTVTVHGEAEMTNTTDAAVSTVVDRQFVENIPLNGRSFQSLIALTPGVVSTPVNGGVDEGQFSVAGQRAGSNYFLVDGVSANFGAANGIFLNQYANGGLPAFSALGSTASLVSIDALQEFRIETSTYAPEYGRESGGQMVLVTRSGTNRFHGTAFNYLRNDAFDANDWFANSTAQPKPRERLNDFGGVVGGPILKDKTFFFFSYEGLRSDQPAVAISDVPSLAARQNAAPGVKAVLDAFPLPNGPSTGANMSQLAASFSNPSSLDAVSLRIDHSINSKLTLFARASHAPSRTKIAGCGGPPSMFCPSDRDVDTGTFGLTAIVTPTITNDFRLNYSRARAVFGWDLDNFGGAIAPSASAIATPWQNLNNGWTWFGAPPEGRNMILIKGLGSDNLNRQTNITDSLGVSRGTHLLKFGFDFRRLTPLGIHPQTGGLYEWITSSFYGGASPDYTAIYQDPKSLSQVFHNFSGFAQDTWKVSRRLTLTYGLRWDYNPPPTVTSGNPPYAISQISDLATATLLPRGTPLWHPDWKNFAPRVGAAFVLRQNTSRPTVIRAGFGQFFDLGTSTAGALDDGQGFFPYSMVTTLCNFGVGSACNSPAPYQGPQPAFAFTQPYAGIMRAFDPHLKLPYALQWNIAVEQTLSPSQTFKVTYVGAAGRRLLRDDAFLNPNPILSGLYLTTNSSYSNYDALQLQFKRRLTHGLQALVSYSWSHSLDLGSADTSAAWGGPSVAVPSTLYNIRQDYGNSDFDIRHSFSAAVTYNIPVPFSQHPVTRAMLRDWSVDFINSIRTGLPFNANYQPADPGEFTGPAGTFYLRPDQVPGQPLYTSDSNVPGGKALNQAAFSIPAVLRQGTEARNNITGFPLLEMDLALRRQFNLTENVRLQFRAEAFNFINHPNFGNPLNTLGTCSLTAAQWSCSYVSGWGTSQSMLNQSMGTLGGYGTAFSPLFQVGGPRSFQLSMKLQF